MVVVYREIGGQVIGGTGDFQQRGTPSGSRHYRRGGLQFGHLLLHEPQLVWVEFWKLGDDILGAHADNFSFQDYATVDPGATENLPLHRALVHASSSRRTGPDPGVAVPRSFLLRCTQLANVAYWMPGQPRPPSGIKP